MLHPKKLTSHLKRDISISKYIFQPILIFRGSNLRGLNVGRLRGPISESPFPAGWFSGEFCVKLQGCFLMKFQENIPGLSWQHIIRIHEDPESNQPAYGSWKVTRGLDDHCSSFGRLAWRLGFMGFLWTNLGSTIGWVGVQQPQKTNRLEAEFLVLGKRRCSSKKTATSLGVPAVSFRGGFPFSSEKMCLKCHGWRVDDIQMMILPTWNLIFPWWSCWGHGQKNGNFPLKIPGSLTWNPENITHPKRKVISHTLFFRGSC